MGKQYSIEIEDNDKMLDQNYNGVVNEDVVRILEIDSEKKEGISRSNLEYREMAQIMIKNLVQEIYDAKWEEYLALIMHCAKDMGLWSILNGQRDDDAHFTVRHSLQWKKRVKKYSCGTYFKPNSCFYPIWKIRHILSQINNDILRILN
jgi:hypothetical protein